MTKITSTMLADMHARRLSGDTAAEIAKAYNIKPMTVYQRLRRVHGLIQQPKPKPANDNVPARADRITKMSAHNGGCSTLSGMMPVTLARVVSIDGPADGGPAVVGSKGPAGDYIGLQVAA